jgi:hypothetical protein
VRFPPPLAAAIALACGPADPAAPIVYDVAYTLTTSGPMAIDSAKYDDGHGTLIKVIAPASGWTLPLTVMTGGSVQAQAWITGSGPGSAKLKVSWTHAGISTQADSSFALPVAAQKFTLTIPHHAL